MARESKGLHQAVKAKNDEFYTQLIDIEKELRYYKKHFEGKTIFCNCDDPYESNFFKYFAMNFNHLGLKKLIATCYVSSPVMYTQLSLFDDMEQTFEKSVDPNKKPYKVEITEVTDENCDGAFDLEDIKHLLKNKKNVCTILNGDGDFRSDECIDLLKESDIVVTNPPFSLFREYVAQLIEYQKKFLIIGNINAINYKEIFPLLMENKVWLGNGMGRWISGFIVPDTYELYGTEACINEKGERIVATNNCLWLTNLDFEKRHEELILVRQYNPDDYPKYDNYDAIEVSQTINIPCDYYGIMGVPITFMDKYNPNQFEILGLSQKVGYGLQSNKSYDEYKEIRQDGSFTGSSGKKTNGNPMIAGKPKKGNYYIDENGNCAYSLYGRIFIRRKDQPQ